MYKKYLRYITLFTLCLLFVFSCFTKKEDQDTTQKNQKTNMQTVIFKDASDTLIPVSVNIACEDSQENNIRGIIEMMKSSDYETLGLYPLFQENLELNTLIIENDQLTFDFTNDLKVKNNQEALDICEALSYLFCQDNINQVNVQIDGKEVSSLENSTIPLSCITSHLGINNFETSTSALYQTSSVMIYNEKDIKGQTYYVPVTTRIDNTKSSLDSQVSLLFNHFDCPKKIETTKEAQLNDGVLSVYLSSQILDDSETLSPILYQRLEKSLLSLPDVDDVRIYVDQQLLDNEKQVTSVIDNKIQI